jgi:RNase P subunit RPR2
MQGRGGTREIVYERMEILLSLAQKALRKKDEKHAKRYVFLARKLSTRYNCRFTREQRMLFCKGCGMPRLLGKNTKVRLRKRQRVAEYSCSCGKRVGFKY